MLSYCTIKETDKGIGNANPLFFCLEKVASCLLFIFISMVFKEFGGVRLFPFSEYVAFCQTYAVHYVDDAWYRVFTDTEDGELDGRDTLIHPLVLGGVESHIPFVESVGRAKHVHEFLTEELR